MTISPRTNKDMVLQSDQPGVLLTDTDVINSNDSWRVRMGDSDRIAAMNTFVLDLLMRHTGGWSARMPAVLTAMDNDAITLG